MDRIYRGRGVGLVTFFIILFFTHSSFAAKPLTVWNNDNAIDSLKSFSIDNSTKSASDPDPYLYNQSLNRSSKNVFRFLKWAADPTNMSHARYNQYYQNIPVWGKQIIFHRDMKQKNSSWLVTGMLVTEINQDIHSLTPHFSQKQIAAFAQHHFQTHNGGSWNLSPADAQLVIYVPEQTKGENVTAKLAYTVFFFARKGSAFQRPFYMIDANDLTVYLQWNSLESAATTDGQGKGGNEKNCTGGGPYYFQYGNAIGSALNTPPLQLGKFDVTVSGANCTMANSDVQIASYGDATGSENLTIYADQEASYPTYSYTCSPYNQDPIEGGYSPNNDAMYAASNTVKMFRAYGYATPLGTGVTRLYTHVGGYSGAHASSKSTSGRAYNQQVIIGNGGLPTLNNEEFYPLSSADIIAHELAHIFTDYTSRLAYGNFQSGGINESYSDITGMTFTYYIHNQYSWYPMPWSNGSLVLKDTSAQCKTKALRYFDDPIKDDHSIGDARNFPTTGKKEMDPHYSSGVYNKAFYLLVTAQGLDIPTAFKIFTNANIGYWAPNSDFSYAACGLQEAANRLGGSNYLNKINAALAGVGIFRCIL